jgi:demethylmenaquinone methyltransferase / 2-methoxy-6-polyprenyl-1,4-benzoquinol methylase
MAKYSHDHIVPYEDSNLGKKEQVSDMFNRIAYRYDFLNRFLSGGTDIYWRKRAIAELKGINPQNILDAATGTADMAIMMTKYLGPATIIGIDISEGMLEIGRKKIEKLHLDDRIRLVLADGESIPFPNDHFDAITVAFGVRNFENLEKGIAEMLRVLKPSGKLIVLEFSKPKQPAFRKLYQVCMRFIAPGLVQFFSKKQAYQYLNKSVMAFPEGEDFLRILSNAGFSNTYRKPLSQGIATIYSGTK